MANLRPDLLLDFRAAALRGGAADAAALREEITRLNAELDRGPLFTGLKRAVAERMAAHGLDYPAHQRAPLGAAPLPSPVD